MWTTQVVARNYVKLPYRYVNMNINLIQWNISSLSICFRVARVTVGGNLWEILREDYGDLKPTEDDVEEMTEMTRSAICDRLNMLEDTLAVSVCVCVCVGGALNKKPVSERVCTAGQGGRRGVRAQ